MKNIIFDKTVIFGPNADEKQLQAMMDYCFGCEQFERNFGLEFSCGDGLFVSDFGDDDDELLDKYDGFVDFFAPPRNEETGFDYEIDVPYRFTICQKDPDDWSIRIDSRDCRFYINEIEIEPN